MSEGDGWNYCRTMYESCPYADEFGRCILPECKLDEILGLDDEDDDE